MEFQGTLNSQNTLEKEEKVVGLTLSDFKIYYQYTINPRQHGIGIKTDIKAKRIEIPEINPHIYGKMSFDKCVKTIQWGSLFSTNGAGTIRYPHAEE